MLNKLKKIYNKNFLPNYSKILYKNKIFLKNGEYSLSSNGKILYLNDSIDSMNNILQTTFDIKKNRLIYKNKKTHNIFKLEKSKSIFLGEMMMFSTSNSEIKFFNFKQKKILTKFKNKKQFKKRIKNMLYFNEHFPLPKIYYVDYEKTYYIERMVDQTEQTLYYLEDLYNNYVNYFIYCYNDNKYKEIDVKDFEKRIKDKYLKKELKKIIDERKELKIPKMKMHGDLWKSNIMVSGNEYYLIDWEWSDEYTIYYDFFTFILNEATLNCNKSLLKLYFDGVFDDKLDECAKIFGHTYLKKYRREYFIIFLCEVSSYRWKGEFSNICPDIVELMKDSGIY